VVGTPAAVDGRLAGQIGRTGSSFTKPMANGSGSVAPPRQTRQSLRGLAAEPLMPARVIGGSCFSGQVWQESHPPLSNRRGEVIIRGANPAGEGPSPGCPHP